MKVTAIKQARFVALFDIDELIPSGLISMSTVVPAIANRFGFQTTKTPRNDDKPDESKGFEFFDGIWDGTPVQRLAIFNDGIILETRVSTSKSREILVESMKWAEGELGIQATSDFLRRPRFVSVLAFQSDAQIFGHSLAINNAAQAMSEAMASVTGKERKYSGIRIDIDFDRSGDKEPVSSFTIQTLALEPFEFSRYYSQAPLPTEQHIALLEKYESDVLGQ